MNALVAYRASPGSLSLLLQVVITTGTFLRGMVHLGPLKYPAGRHTRDSAGASSSNPFSKPSHRTISARAPPPASDVEPPSVGLAATLERLPVPPGASPQARPRASTAAPSPTPGLEQQWSDDPPPAFSYANDARGVKQAGRLICCHRTATHQPTHDIIEKYRHLLPTFEAHGGKGQGPRYCPAIEKKARLFRALSRTAVVRDHEAPLCRWCASREGRPPHLARARRCARPPVPCCCCAGCPHCTPPAALAGLSTDTVYPSGLNTAFPAEVQEEMLRTIPGLEGVRMVRSVLPRLPPTLTL